jgi:hypothetical protein
MNVVEYLMRIRRNVARKMKGRGGMGSRERDERKCVYVFGVSVK